MLEINVFLPVSSKPTDGSSRRIEIGCEDDSPTAIALATSNLLRKPPDKFAILSCRR